VQSQASKGEQIMRCPTLSELPPPPKGKKGWPWTEETPQLPETMPGGMPWPRVSIVTPSYNQGRFIEETIRSVLLQGYPELEYIIIDGGSTDSSVEIIKKYEKWLTYWVSEPDRGQSHAINKGFEKATGEIYSWLNSDDYLLKDALKNVATAYNASPRAGAWCGGALLVNRDNRILMVRWPKVLNKEGIANWHQNSFQQSACFFSKSAWEKCKPLDENLHYAMDFDLWLRVAGAFSIEKASHVLSADHVHANAKTYKEMGHMYAEIFVIQIRHGYDRLAIEEVSKWFNEYASLKRKLGQFFRFPLFRVFKPIAQYAWEKLLGV